MSSGGNEAASGRDVGRHIAGEHDQAVAGPANAAARYAIATPCEKPT